MSPDPAVFWICRMGGPTFGRGGSRHPHGFSARCRHRVEWQCTHDVAWYASTGRQTARILRRRDARPWGVENRVHYVLNVSMHEDASRVRKAPHPLHPTQLSPSTSCGSTRSTTCRRPVAHAMNLNRSWHTAGTRK